MSAPSDDLATVITAGRQSRAALAANLAGAFRRDPKKFEPQSLERLGRAGLKQFLGEIGATGAPSAAKQTDHHIPQSTSTSIKK